MKPLIAIMSCHMFAHRAQAQRETWVQDCAGKIDYRFFVGEGDGPIAEDMVKLDCPDDYQNFPLKVQAMRRWCLANGYGPVLKLDDDTYVAVDRLVKNIPLSDYSGRLRGCSGGYPAPYCSGFAYWQSTRAMEKLVTKEWNGDTAEDRWTGNELFKEGIMAGHEPGYQVCWSKRNALSGRECPLEGNRVIVACEYSPDQLKKIHEDYKNGVRTKYTQTSISSGSLNRVTVMIKTFLRDGYLLACLEGLRRNFPDTKVVVADDGWSSPEKVTKYAELIAQGHECIWLPFDSGFGAKSNAALDRCDTEYVLIGSDDFDFSDNRVRPGICKMIAILDANPSIGVASGRVDGNPYESCLDIVGPEVRERAGHHATQAMGDTQFHLCDLTVNYSLIRRKLFEEPQKIRWENDIKIGGGEHGAFFVDVMRAGWRVCVVEGAVVYQFKHSPNWMHPAYVRYRHRAAEPGRLALRRRGIERWICQDGRIEIA